VADNDQPSWNNNLWVKLWSKVWSLKTCRIEIRSDATTKMTALSLDVFVGVRCEPSSEPVGGVIPVVFLRAVCWKHLQPTECWPQGFFLAGRASLGTIDHHQPVHSTTSHGQGNTHAYALLPLSISHTPLINSNRKTLHPYGWHKLGSVARSKNKTQSRVQRSPNRHQGVMWQRKNTIQLGLEGISKDWLLLIPCN